MYTAIILMAGKGLRTTLSTNKTNLMLNHKPVYKHSLDLFQSLGFNVVLVINKNDEDFIRRQTPNINYTYGGKTRGDSVYNGLKLVNSKYVFIHDGARPFINREMVLKIKDLLLNYDAVLTSKNIFNTIYDKTLNVIDRDNLLQAETPQAFLTEKIKEAYSNKQQKNYTDDISVYKDYFNDEIGLYIHDYKNDKITDKKDVEKYLMPNIKIGHSYDIHQTTKERKLILGGIEIKNDFGLLGHSDADVLLHVVAESIFGALGIGDLGTHFPDTDKKNKDLDSKTIVNYAVNKLIEYGYNLENMDLTVFLEKPKLQPYIKKIKKSVSELLKIDQSNINIKASTYEKLDAIGNQKAIAAEAVCLIKKRS